MFLWILNIRFVDPVAGNNLAKATFYVSFENSDDSINEWVEFKDPMPDLSEFSICHWDKPKSFNDNLNSIWSYCFSSKYGEGIDCMQLWFDLIDSTANRHINIAFRISYKNANLKRKHIHLKAKIKPYKHRTWNHYCWLYSNFSRKNELYWNGNLVGSMILPDDDEVNWRDKHSGVQSAFIIGQEQDKLRGGYQRTQAFTGYIAEVNVWDYRLDENKIQDLAKCKKLWQGNIRAWKLQKLVINEAKVVKGVNSNVLCEPERKLIIFPKRLPLLVAKDTCEIHGGKVVTPYTDEENKEVIEIVKKHHNNCVDPKTTEKRNWGKLTWLGLKRENAEWFDIGENGTILNSINYSNWNTHHYADNIDCAYIQTDSTWQYNNGICAQNLCTVCAVEGTPVFTMKGICNSSNAGWNYYMSFDSKNEINAYEGYKGNKIFKDDNGMWYSRSNSFRLKLVPASQTNTLIGRQKWQSKDQLCKEDETHHMTFSRCEFGEQFTCDSGHCIDIRKKCDGVIDCSDKSDENYCTLVKIPKSYKVSRPPESNISTRIWITNIHDIDTKTMQIEYTSMIRMSWTDNRLKFSNLHRSFEEVSNSTKLQIWNAFDYVEYKNALIGNRYLGRDELIIKRNSSPLALEVVDPFEDRLFDGGMNLIVAKQTARGVYDCTFQLTKFPFDTQRCNFFIRLRGHRGPQFIVDAVQYRGDPILNNFKLEEMKAYSEFKNKRASITFTLIMSRQYVYQLLTTFFPSWLIWLVSYLTFFISPNNFNNRFMGSVTSLLVLTSLLNSVQSTLPETAYFKNIDCWFLWFISNSIVMIAAHVIIDNLSDSGQNRIHVMNPDESESLKITNINKTKLNRLVKVSLPIINIFFYLFYVFLHL